MSFRLDGKAALITAAAQGIGAASARITADMGAAVMIADLNEAGARQTAEKIVAAGGKARAIGFDARNKESVRAAVRAAYDAFGRLDILHNNAGGTYPGRDTQAADLDDETWDDVFAWNIGCTHWATQAAIPLMLKNSGGAIVNTVTGGAMVAYSTNTAYAASKGAVISYTRSVAVQYGRRGIRCNAIAPGLILTPHVLEALPPEFRENSFENVAATRAGIPDDIGHMAAFLASDAAAYINGQIMSVDGAAGIRSGGDARTVAHGGYGPGHPAPTQPVIIPEIDG